MKIFLDANIIIDFLDNNRSFHQQANEIIEYAVKNGYNIVVSEDILTTVYYVCKKNVDNKKLFAFFEMIVREFEISCFGKNVIKESIGLCKKDKKLDFEDILQAICAKNTKCSAIITNDKNFAQVGIMTQTAKDFVK